MKKILFVDDELINRKLFSKLMSDYDMELELAEDGMTAMPMLMEKQYDLIFMDHMMPKISGMELLQNIRSIEFNPNVAIETGYMMAKPNDKYICILKDTRIKTLPTDFLGKLYKEYDMNSLSILKQQLYDWIKDHFF